MMDPLTQCLFTFVVGVPAALLSSDSTVMLHPLVLCLSPELSEISVPDLSRSQQSPAASRGHHREEEPCQGHPKSSKVFIIFIVLGSSSLSI